MKLDNTTLQVLANYCAAAAESMGWTLMRTAHSTFVKETEDFSCQVLTPEGLTVASPKTFGATWYTGLDYGGVIPLFDYREGDICLHQRSLCRLRRDPHPRHPYLEAGLP